MPDVRFHAGCCRHGIMIWRASVGWVFRSCQASQNAAVGCLGKAL